MATVNLDILVRMADQTRAGMVGIRQNLRAANRDADGLRGSLDRADRTLGGLQRDLDAGAQRWANLGRVAQQAGQAMVVAGGLATAALAALAGTSIKASSDLNESTSKTQVVFGDASQAVIDFANKAAKSLGQSTQAAMEASATFGNLFLGLGMGKGEAANMSMEMVQLATDLASFNNIPVEDALEKLRSGLIGEAEPLRSVGVLLSETAVQAKAMEMGLGKGAKGLTEQEKVLARYQIILDQTKTAQGDFARTSSGLANQQRILAASITNAKAALGDALRPALQALLQVLTPVVDKLAEMIRAHPRLTAMGFAVAAATALITLGMGSLLMLLPGIINGWNLLTAALTRNAAAARAAAAANAAAGAGATAGGAGAAAGAGGRVVAGLKAVLPALIRAVAGAWGAIAPVLGSIAGAFAPIVAALEWIVGGVGAVAGAIAGLPIWIILAIVAAVVALGVGIWQLVKHWGAVKTWFAGLWGSIKDGLSGAASAVANFAGNIGGSFVAGLQAAWQGFLDFFSNLPRNLGKALGLAVQGVVYGVAWIIGALQQLPATIPVLLNQAWAAIAAWATGTYQTVVAWAVNLPGAIAGGLTAAYQGIVAWAQSAWGAIAGWVSNTYSTIAGWIAGLPAQVAQGMSNLWQTFRQWLDRIWADIAAFFARIWEGFKSIPSRAMNALKGIGSEAAGGFREGAGSLAGAAAAGQQAGRRSVEVHNHFEGPTYGVQDLDEKIRRGATRAQSQTYGQTQYGWSGAG